MIHVGYEFSDGWMDGRMDVEHLRRALRGKSRSWHTRHPAGKVWAWLCFSEHSLLLGISDTQEVEK